MARSAPATMWCEVCHNSMEPNLLLSRYCVCICMCECTCMCKLCDTFKSITFLIKVFFNVCNHFLVTLEVGHATHWAIVTPVLHTCRNMTRLQQMRSFINLNQNSRFCIIYETAILNITLKNNIGSLVIILTYFFHRQIRIIEII
jgi:hypothetical protein